MGVKVAVVGGGSTYTPELVEGFVTRTDRLPVDELVLLDVGSGATRDRRRARGTDGACCRMGRNGPVDRPGDGGARGANFVIVQLRVGGNQARFQDETIPLRFGFIGQETTGPGGFAKALRTVPVVLELAERTAEVGAPDAWVVDFTNPTGLVTQALLDQGHRACGLCNVAIGVQRDLANHLHVEPARVRLDHVGLNHLSWVRAVSVDGVDRLPELLAEGSEELTEAAPIELVRALGAIPSSYLRYYYRTSEVLEHQRSHRTRAEEVLEIEAGCSSSIAILLSTRSRSSWRSAGERGTRTQRRPRRLVARRHGRRASGQRVERGRDPERAAGRRGGAHLSVDRAGAFAQPTDPLAPEMLGLVQHARRASG
jgi:Alpha-galactosidases/6-phospho-beta-glucosidases, family 4 of glycosyl hydrolases